MAGENPNAKELKKRAKKNDMAGPRSIAADPEAFKKRNPKSKLHHKKGK